MNEMETCPCESVDEEMRSKLGTRQVGKVFILGLECLWAVFCTQSPRCRLQARKLEWAGWALSYNSGGFYRPIDSD